MITEWPAPARTRPPLLSQLELGPGIAGGPVQLSSLVSQTESLTGTVTVTVLGLNLTRDGCHWPGPGPSRSRCSDSHDHPRVTESESLPLSDSDDHATNATDAAARPRSDPARLPLSESRIRVRPGKPAGEPTAGAG